MSTNPSPLDGTCARCQQSFHCGVADAAPCPCIDLVLTPELTAALRVQFDGCLCLACLAELQVHGEPLRLS